MVLVTGRWLDDKCDLQKVLFNITVERELWKAKSLLIQGSFLGMEDIQLKSLHSFLYNWRLDDNLVKFAVKARLSILPANFTLYL